MIVIKCMGCGWHDVVDDAWIDTARYDDDEAITGHHVYPDDPVADWICYGRRKAIIAQNILDDFAVNGPRALRNKQPPSGFAERRADQEAKRALRIANRIPKP